MEVTIPVMRSYPVTAVYARMRVREDGFIHPMDELIRPAIIFMREGTLHIRVEECEYHVEPGQVLLFCAGDKIVGTQPTVGRMRFYWLHYDVAMSSMAQTDTLTLPRVLTVTRPLRLAELFRLLIEDINADTVTTHSPSILTNLMLSHIAESVTGSSSKSDDPPDALVELVKGFIRVNVGRAFTIAEIADFVQRTPNYLGKVFRRREGISITEWAIGYRLYLAKYLLLDSDKLVKEVASECGFGDVTYFSRLFRSREGVSPREYRICHSGAFIV